MILTIRAIEYESGPIAFFPSVNEVTVDGSFQFSLLILLFRILGGIIRAIRINKINSL